MALIVQKFGGTSIGSPDRIKNVARNIAQSKSKGLDLVVVVSAMGHTTDELISLAQEVSSEPPHREMDMLLTAGERISMALLCMALSDLKIHALSLTGSQSGIVTTDSHRRARIKHIAGERIRSALNENKVVIVAGFQGVSDKKEITTLGRGGSDTTAVALSAFLKADICEIYSDVDGVFSADPRIVPNAKFLPLVSYDHMLELSQRGAGVLHPRSVELARTYQVQLWVKNSQNSHPGTEIRNIPLTLSDPKKGGVVEASKVIAVTADSTKSLLKVQLMRPGSHSSLWDFATSKGLSLLTPFFNDQLLYVYVEREYENDWKSGLNQLAIDGFIKNFEMMSDYIPLSLIGERLCQDGAVLNSVLEVLASNQISVTMGSSSSLAITFAVHLSNYEQAIKSIHEKLIIK